MSIQRLGDYIEQYSHKNKNDDPYPVYSVTNSEGFCTEYFNKDVSGKKKTNYKIVPKGYFAYNPSRINVGSIDWQNSEDNVIVSPIYVVFKCLKELDQDYLKYFIKSPEGIRMINSKVSGAVRNNLRFEDLSEFEFNIVEYDKQIEVVNMLKLIEKAIDNEKNQLKLYDELIKARFVEMFGDTKYAFEKWGGKPFKEITINLDSKRKPVKDADRQKMQGSYPYYGATGIVDHVNDFRQEGTFLLISEDGKALEFRNKPIAFIASGKIWVNNHAHVQQCTEDCNMIYLMYIINMMDISQWVTGIDQKKLNRKNLDSIPIALPPIELQVQFENIVKQVDKSKVVVQERIKVYEELLNKKLYEYYIV